jgi:hypothetical protein
VEGLAPFVSKLVDDPFLEIGASGGAELSNFCVVDSGE